MIGYKAFDENLCCRGFQYEVGKTYTTDTKKEDLECCTDKGFHFCRELQAIEKESDYKLSQSRICEVIAGDYVRDNDKYITNSITILREIVGAEKKELLNYNSGSYNSGYRNSGSYNSGDSNSGKFNSGDSNSGNCNSGDSNSGKFNSGNSNSGYFNSGDANSGDSNSGYRNSGNCNSGDFNSGNANSGNRNSGNANSGYYNSGSRNSGSYNSGSYNSGNFNSSDYNSGFFNSNEPTVRMFNKDTGLKRSEIRIPNFCYFDLTKWVDKDNATEEEKIEHKNEIKTCGGFLKTLDYKEAWRIAWDNADKEEHKKILELPNYDNAIFKEITGIDAEAEIKKEQ